MRVRVIVAVTSIRQPLQRAHNDLSRSFVRSLARSQPLTSDDDDVAFDWNLSTRTWRVMRPLVVSLTLLRARQTNVARKNTKRIQMNAEQQQQQQHARAHKFRAKNKPPKTSKLFSIYRERARAPQSRRIRFRPSGAALCALVLLCLIARAQRTQNNDDDERTKRKHVVASAQTQVSRGRDLARVRLSSFVVCAYVRALPPTLLMCVCMPPRAAFVL